MLGKISSGLHLGSHVVWFGMSVLSNQVLKLVCLVLHSLKDLPSCYRLVRAAFSKALCDLLLLTDLLNLFLARVP